jgi:TM2 domain-containing membrane protein YozV
MFTFCLILGWHAMIAGDVAALSVAAFCLVFWGGRIFIDAFFFDHSDWPKGSQFVVGHTFLTFAFSYLVVAYGAVVAWHLLV